MKKKEKAIIILVSILLAVLVVVASYYVYYQKQVRSAKIESIFDEKSGVVDEYRIPTKEEDSVKSYSKQKILYKKGNGLFLYDIAKKEKISILSSDVLLDFDLSSDGKKVAYSLKEDGFDGNADIYVKDIVAGKTTRLTEKNDIASVNPKITPDGKKVLYIRRTKNKEYPEYLDDALWAINIDGNQDSSYEIKKIPTDYSELVKNKDIYCYGDKELKDPKSQIMKISPDSSRVLFNTLDIGNCVGSSGSKSFVSTKNGANILNEKFASQNRSTWIYDGKTEVNWITEDVFLFDNGDFVTSGHGGSPIGGASYYYFDKDLNKKWEVYDSNKIDEGLQDADVGFFINDMKKMGDGSFVAFTNFFERNGGRYKFQIVKMKLGEKLNIYDMYNKGDFLFVLSEDVYMPEILDENHIFYKKFKSYDGPTYDYFVYDLKNKKEELIASDLTE